MKVPSCSSQVPPASQGDLVQGPGPYQSINIVQQKLWIMERKQSSGFRRIFTVVFLLTLVLAGPLTLRGNH